MHVGHFARDHTDTIHIHHLRCPTCDFLAGRKSAELSDVDLAVVRFHLKT